MTKVFVGFPVTYILMSLAMFFSSIASGSLRSLKDLVPIINNSLFISGAIIMGSIVCTLGISLIIWIPMWRQIGAMTIAIAPRIANALNRARPEAINLPLIPSRATPSQLAIANYIKKAEDSNLSDRAIENRLVANGWTEEEIELGRRIATAEQGTNRE